MPKNVDPEAIVNIPCPKCGEKIEQTAGALEFSPALRCPVCGASFVVNYQKLRQKLEAAAEKAALEARRRFGG